MLTYNNKTRLDLLDEVHQNAILAELGTFEGNFADNILRRCRPQHLYVVDLFEGVVGSGDENGENFRCLNMGVMKPRLERHFGGKPVTIVKSDSVSWLLGQPGVIDFVYIDTIHDFKQTLAELVASTRATKRGGWICGHDYDEKFPGVIQAVDLYCSAFGVPATIYRGDRLASFKIINAGRIGG
jgi:hypothetical protein